MSKVDTRKVHAMTRYSDGQRVGIVFPYETRLLCRWHITKNIRKHCKTLIPLKAKWKSFRAMWSILVESPTWTSYTENYRKLSRVEGQHSALKKYLQEKNYSLAKFVGAIDWFMKSQLTAINDSFEKSMIVSKHKHKFLCFDLLRGNVSLKALDMLVEELQQVHQFDSSNCGCKLQNSCGLPCACMLSTYLNSAECIPLEPIDVFWRKLKISPSIPMENEDICGDGKFEMIKETYNKQPKAVKKSMMRKLLDIFQPSKTHIREPAIQKIHKQKQKQTDSINQAPRSCNFSTTSKFVELNNRELARHSSYITTIPDLKEEPQSCYNQLLIDEIQVMFHPYITHIQDAEGDGNYGFRAISVCLGYGENDQLYVQRQLLDELLSSYDAYARVFTIYTSLNFLQSTTPTSHWLLMPEFQVSSLPTDLV
uniref:Protein FAR1-RELATED SEQUENCE n=1 Tax=Lactuca sativa TaxID=4236 RepID=A0A9R1UGN8_LACSA|nr:hypothetical protein LSAT_V11C900494370 [Lactuca sativa]